MRRWRRKKEEEEKRGEEKRGRERGKKGWRDGGGGEGDSTV